MEFKDGIMILLNLAILGTVIAAAIYIFQIGDKKRSVSCTAISNCCGGVDSFMDKDCSGSSCGCIIKNGTYYYNNPTLKCPNGTCQGSNPLGPYCKCADAGGGCASGEVATCWAPYDSPDDDPTNPPCNSLP